MNILFYYDPLIYYNNPKWRQAHPIFDIALYKNLKKSNYNCRLLLPKHYDFNKITSLGVSEIDITLIDKNFITDIFQSSEINTDPNLYFLRNEDSLIIQKISAKIKDFLYDYQPDIVISWTPVPFLKQAYSNAIILYEEKGMMQGKLWGKSFYLDHMGFYSNSFLAQKIKENNFIYDQEKHKLLQNQQLLIKKKLKSFIANFKIKLLRTKYQKIMLLPLHYSGYFTFDGFCNFRSQQELLEYVISNIPEDIALIVTFNNHSNVTFDNLSNLCNQYENLYIWNIRNKSDRYLLYIDGLITVNSSLALKALFVGKPVFTLDNDNYLGGLVYRNLDNIHQDIDSYNPKKANPALNWMLEKYFIDYSRLQEQGWAQGYFDQLKLKMRDEGEKLS